VERKEPKLGLTFRYNPTEAAMKGEVRTYPVAVFELTLTQELTSRMLVTVEECDAEITNEAYKQCSLSQVGGTVKMLREKVGTLGGHPAVEFEYAHAERHVWVILTVVKKRAFCVHYNADALSYRCITIAHDLAKTITIGPSQPGDSFLFFTEPRYGLGMKLPVSRHIDTSASTLERGVIACFLALHDTMRGGDMLDKSFMEIRVLHDIPVRPANIDATLEAACAALKRLIEASVGDGEVLVWKSGSRNNTPRTAASFLRREMNTFQPHNMVLKRTNASGRYLFYDITCKTEGAESANSTIVVQYVAFVCVVGNEAFVLTAWSEEEHFQSVYAVAKESFHTLCFGNQYGQEDSLLYCNPSYRFSIRVPSQLQVHEPPIGDPLVLFTPASDTTAEDITSTWVSVDINQTDSVPTMSSDSVPTMSPATVAAEAPSNATAYGFTVHIRVQDAGGSLKLSELAAEFVSEVRLARCVEVEEETATALDGVAAKSVVFTQSCEDGAMMKCWTVLLLNGGKQYIIQLATTAQQFRQWKKLFRGMLSSFRLHTVDMR